MLRELIVYEYVFVFIQTCVYIQIKLIFFVSDKDEDKRYGLADHVPPVISQ